MGIRIWTRHKYVFDKKKGVVSLILRLLRPNRWFSAFVCLFCFFTFRIFNTIALFSWAFPLSGFSTSHRLSIKNLHSCHLLALRIVDFFFLSYCITHCLYLFVAFQVGSLSSVFLHLLISHWEAHHNRTSTNGLHVKVVVVYVIVDVFSDSRTYNRSVRWSIIQSRFFLITIWLLIRVVSVLN